MNQKIRIRLAIGFVLVFLIVIPVFVNAFEITPEPGYFPKRDKINVPKLFMFKASLRLKGDEVWLKFSVMNHAKQSYSFLVWCELSSQGDYLHEWVDIGPHKKITRWWKVRPCYDGERTSLVPVHAEVWSVTWPKEHVYSDGFMLEIPSDWNYTVTAW